MLCDSWLEYMLQRGGPIHADGPFPPHFAPHIPELRELQRAQRFVFAPDAARVAAELADAESAERVRHAAFAPAWETWLEWSDPGNGKRVGVLLTAEGDSKLAVAGHGVFVTDAVAVSGLRDYVALPICWNLAGPGPAVVLNAEPVIQDIVRMGFPDFLERLDIEQLGYWLVAALSLLNAQRVTTMRDADLARLNKRRRDKGRAEFLVYREIILTLTAEQVMSNRAETESDRVGRFAPCAGAFPPAAWRGDDCPRSLARRSNPGRHASASHRPRIEVLFGLGVNR